MHQNHFALALNAIAYLAAPAKAQFITGPLESATPALPHTAVYTTTVARNPSSLGITTVVVTLIVPRDVGHPTNTTSSSLVTGTAISHFSASQLNGAVSTWSETAELAWTTTAGNPNDPQDAPPPQPAKTTLTAAYTDYQHVSLSLYGAWAEMHWDFCSKIRETIVEVVGAAYPATIVRTGYTDIKVAATIAYRNGPTTTDPDRESTVSVRTTTLVQVSSRPVLRG